MLAWLTSHYVLSHFQFYFFFWVDWNRDFWGLQKSIHLKKFKMSMFENRVFLLYITLKYLSIVIILQFLQKATSKDLKAANMFAISVQKIYV